ncbi:MAG: FHA domain-containing protein [Lachnospiraceae bacterium]|nr:FHA domain-containing protein [Lachnospiraceae bacterium]
MKRNLCGNQLPTYGTFLNGKRLARGEAARIKNKDRIMVGDGQVFEVEF